MGYEKREEEQKLFCSKKEKEKESSHALKEKLEEGNFSKEYHFHHSCHTPTHLDQFCMTCFSL
jgi:hypothetical protein